jgi:AraC-like DNA-binding protein
MQSSRFESPSVCWEMWTRDAAPALRPHVLGYCGYREWGSAGFRRLETPSREVHVILSFGPRIRSNGEVVRSFVAAPHTRHAVVESFEDQHCVELRLTPLGAHLALGVPLDELADRTHAFEDVWGGDELIARLGDLPSWAARFDLLDRVLAARLAAARPLAPEVEGAWLRLVATHGSVPIAELVRASGWSRRHLARRFAAAAGLTPKTFARVLRFDRAKARLEQPFASLAEVALDCGYYDQAHFTRDFREFAGCTPAELLARRLPAGYAAAEVTSVQDGARAAA